MDKVLLIILGSVLSIGGTIVSHLWIERRKRLALVSAFQGEIAALLKIVEKRDYVNGLKNNIANMQTTGYVSKYYFQAHRDYFNVYRENVASLGLLNPPLPELIARFYTQANGVIEDMDRIAASDPSTVNVQEAIRVYQEVLYILEDTIEVGNEIITAHPNKHIL